MSIKRGFRVKEAAEYTGLKVPTLNKFRFEGSGPVYVKMGHAVIYLKDDLDRWLDAQRVTSTSEADSR